MWSPTRLHVRDDFALEPSEVCVDGQHDEQQKGNFDKRDDDFGVLVEKVDHGCFSASGKDSIMVQ